MKDYQGKFVFVGIDVHKRTYFLTSICEGEIVKRDSVKASPEHLVAYLKKYFPHAAIKSA